MRVYVAGPMRGYPELNFPAFDKAKGKLEAEGHYVLSPADLDRREGITPESWAGLTPEKRGAKLKEIVRRDFEAIIDVDAIYLLEGWEESTGARAELALARWLKLKVMDTQPAVPMVNDSIHEHTENTPLELGTIKVGEKLREASGAMRHSREGKGRYDLLSPRVMGPFCTEAFNGAAKHPLQTWIEALQHILKTLFDISGTFRAGVAMRRAFRDMHDYIHALETQDNTMSDRVAVSRYALHRLALHMENGIKAGYDARNWERGISLGRFLDSAIRHTLQELNGEEDEDHAAAAFWNMHGFIHTWEAIGNSELPESLNDLKTNARKEKHVKEESPLFTEEERYHLAASGA